MTDQPTVFSVPGHGEVRIVADAEALAQAAAERFVQAVQSAVAARGRATVALSGGSTPKRMGELLATDAFRPEVAWDRVEIFWGDERWVPESSCSRTQPSRLASALSQSSIALP